MVRIFVVDVGVLLFLCEVFPQFCESLCVCFDRTGRLAQMVERPLRMREVGGSIPPMSNSLSFITHHRHQTVGRHCASFDPILLSYRQLPTR